MREQDINISFTFEFKRNLRGLAKKYRSIRSDIEILINQLQSGQLPGVHIPGLKLPVYKVRLKNSDIQKGKSAGFCCIYYLKNHQNIILVTVYSKADQSDIANATIKSIFNEIGYE